MRPDVADIAEHKADEHEEKADQRERSGRADHLCGQADKKSTSVLLRFLPLEQALSLFPSCSTGGCFLQQVRSRSFQYMVSKMETEAPTAQRERCPEGVCVLWCVTFYRVSECEAFIVGGRLCGKQAFTYNLLAVPQKALIQTTRKDLCTGQLCCSV